MSPEPSLLMQACATPLGTLILINRHSPDAFGNGVDDRRSRGFQLSPALHRAYRQQQIAGLQGVVWSLPPRRPVDRDHASEDERHSDFRFDVRQVIGNPPRGVGVPINERRIASCKIPVKPESYAR